MPAARLRNLILILCLSVCLSVQAQGTFNQRVTDTYIDLTGANRVYSPQSMYDRSEYYTNWNEYAARFYEFYPNGDPNCCVAFSVKADNTQVFYAPTQDEYLIHTIYHEHLHTDVIALQPIDNYRSAWGFMIVYGAWDHTELVLFDEIFIDTLATLMMHRSGYPAFESHRYTQNSQMFIILTDLMKSHNLSLSDLWQLHTESRLIEFLGLIGGDVQAGYEIAQRIEDVS